MRLEAYNRNKKVLSNKIDIDFIDLLTKRYNSKRNYSGGAVKTFKKLIELSGQPMNKRSKKFQLCNTVKYYKTPDELVKRLQLLISSIEAGNKSVAVKNEIVEILDKLLIEGCINKTEYKNIYHNYI